MPTFVVGAITPPAMPASTVAYTNNFGFACLVTVFGGTVTAIATNGVTVKTVAGLFLLSNGASITITYSVAPTWTWFGLG